MPSDSSTHRDTRRGARQRASARPGLLFGVLAVLGGFIAAVSAFGFIQANRDGALPGAHVGGIDVSGQDHDQLVSTVSRLPVRERFLTLAIADAEVTDSAEAFGYHVDVEATASRVLRRGRQPEPWYAVADHLRAFIVDTELPPVETVDHDVLTERLEEIDAEIGEPPQEPTIEFVDGQVVPAEGEPGVTIDIDATAAAIEEALVDQSTASVEAVTVVSDPQTTEEDLQAAVEAAEQAISAPVSLTRGEAVLELDGGMLATMLEVEIVEGQGELAINAQALDDYVNEGFRDHVFHEPVDASIDIVGEDVQITPSEEGFAFSAEIAAEQLLELATSDGERTAEMQGEQVQPEHTTEEVEEYGINELVATFTTEHACCQGRVTNIQRMADLVDGTLLAPGDEFSINEDIGPRTTDLGFTTGGMIDRGQLVDVVGGGVSQFATTLFNAAWFGGYDIPDWQNHSFYISRYPVGREATLHYPSIDLVIHNNSPHGMLFKTSYTDTSITVSIYGTNWVEVESHTSDGYNYRTPPDQIRETSDLGSGQQRVLQGNQQGFDVTLTRTLSFPDGNTETEEHVVSYYGQPRIIERGTGE